MPALPMFPLGSVLLPGAPLSLQVFEPRYVALVERCLRTSPEFGVVLIERGSEVGGGDTRTDVGTVAHILEVASTVDGRLLLQAVGTRRIRVEAWLPDDPHPIADAVDWPDAGPVPSTSEVEACAAALRSVLALWVELGEPGPDVTFEVPDDPVVASYALTALAPLGPLDRHRLLGAPTVSHRLDLLAELLADERAVLEARLSGS